MEIHSVDPAKLEAIREQWKQRSDPKRLLLDRSQREAAEPPVDARYFSDRNIRVEKEQRARSTQVIPKPGAGPGQDQRTAARQEPPKPRYRVQKLGGLGNLGVPLLLTTPPPMKDAPQEVARAEPTRAGGGDQETLEDRLPEGSQNLLNAQESVYYSFYARLYEAVGPLWQSRVREVPAIRRVVPGDYVTVVDVVFDRYGNLIGVRRLQTSGIPEFDQAAESVWRRVSRFPNPPRDLLDARGEVHTGWTFTVRMTRGFQWNYLPPERRW